LNLIFFNQNRSNIKKVKLNISRASKCLLDLTLLIHDQCKKLRNICSTGKAKQFSYSDLVRNEIKFISPYIRGNFMQYFWTSLIVA
jgi:hypothetical protein